MPSKKNELRERLRWLVPHENFATVLQDRWDNQIPKDEMDKSGVVHLFIEGVSAEQPIHESSTCDVP